MEEIYNPKDIEFMVQKYWHKNNTFKVKEDPNKKKYYCLSMLPYPSGKLHIGHVRNYTIGDVISRYQRLLGKNVLHPIGWDAFGLPAEKAAYENNISPSKWTYFNIKYMKNQLKMLGFGYDWSREITTCDPEYYKWEQWFFNILYKKGLVYKKKSPVNWCPQDKTVLANEQVIDGTCWRCDTKIQYKQISQWFLKITKYADELLYNLDKLKDWPEKVKIMQKNWIGRSEGIEINFQIFNNKSKIKIYTTRLDTLMGVTYIVLSIFHPISIKISKYNKKIKKFIYKNNNVKILNYDISKVRILGIDSEIQVLHPITKEKLPVWISNFVSINYGTGAIMAVPAHNKFDFEFANKYKLNKKIVILDKDGNKPNIKNMPMIKKGILFNSGEFNGLNFKDSFNVISNKLLLNGIGKLKVNYKLRDWSVSRQRYWGVPIAMITLKNGITIPVPNKELPVILPEYKKIKKTNNPLKMDSNWFKTIFNGEIAFRDTDTFDTFMESSWYYVRYTCPNYSKGIINSTSANYWLPIDQYIGGIEHATMHLIYFRFYHKLFRDIGLVNSNEPAKKLLCQGMVLFDAFYYFDKNGKRIWISPFEVSIERNDYGQIINAFDKNKNKLIYAGKIKMSKSKKNGIDPEKIIEKYGADTIRLFIMFAAPVDMSLEWNDSGLKGANRFLKRLWNLTYQYIKIGISKNTLNINLLNNNQKVLFSILHKTILKVTNDINIRQKFNTAISSIMELINKLFLAPKKTKQDLALFHEALSSSILMLYPFTPHICFVLWSKLGNKINIDNAKWPIFNKNATKELFMSIVIQINGKLKGKIVVPINSKLELIRNIAYKENKIIKYLKGVKIKKIIYVNNKILNFVIN